MMVWEGLFRYGCPGCFRDQAIDVVVTDIKLAPGEPHGLALARMIRRKNLRMPIILMTVDPQLIEGEALPGSLLKNHLGLRPPVGVETAEVYPLCGRERPTAFVGRLSAACLVFIWGAR
jgi:hypothetical protein